MSLIPVDISEDEILVKFLFDVDFKNKAYEKDKIIKKEIFFPNKGGVSIQRYEYSSESVCKAFGIQISDSSKQSLTARKREFFGFILFTRKIFDSIVAIQKKDSFIAQIQYSPIDADGQYIVDINNVNMEDAGNVGHSDIIYINPEVKDEEVPNIAIRAFSSVLCNKCEIVLDVSPPLEFNGIPFSEIL